MTYNVFSGTLNLTQPASMVSWHPSHMVTLHTVNHGKPQGVVIPPCGQATLHCNVRQVVYTLGWASVANRCNLELTKGF